jgi:uncharacterized RDD family membrane protein YckC
MAGAAARAAEELPASAPGGAPPASAWRRLMCIVYEAIILFGVTFFFGYAFSALTQFRGDAGALRWAFQVFMFAVLAVYFTWSWSAGRRTLPMKTLGVRLVARDGRAPTAARALARYAIAVAMLSLALAGARYVHGALALLALLPAGWSLFDRDRRALYDVVAGTRLVVGRD